MMQGDCDDDHVDNISVGETKFDITAIPMKNGESSKISESSGQVQECVDKSQWRNVSSNKNDNPVVKDEKDRKIEFLKSVIDKQRKFMEDQMKEMDAFLDGCVHGSIGTSENKPEDKQMETIHTGTDTLSLEEYDGMVNIADLAPYISLPGEIPIPWERFQQIKMNTKALEMKSFQSVVIWTKGYFDSINRLLKVVNSRKPSESDRNASIYKVRCQQCDAFLLEWKQSKNGFFYVGSHKDHSSQCRPTYSRHKDRNGNSMKSTNYCARELAPLLIPVIQSCLASRSECSNNIAAAVLRPYVRNLNGLSKTFLYNVRKHATSLLLGNLQLQGKHFLCHFHHFHQYFSNTISSSDNRREP